MPVLVNRSRPDMPVLQARRSTLGLPEALLFGEWTTTGLARCFGQLNHAVQRCSDDTVTRWDLSGISRMDHTGALFLWRTWGQAFPAHLVLPAPLSSYFRVLSPDRGPEGVSVGTTRSLQRLVESLGHGTINLVTHASAITSLMSVLTLDLINLLRYPRRWPAREITATVFRAGVQALGIIGLVGFLIGVVLSYVAGGQLREFGIENYIVNLLGIGCVRELGPLLAAIIVAGRSGSAIAAQLGVMRLNEELNALTTIGVRYTQRLVVPKVIALAIVQPLLGLWTSALALLGGMLAAHWSLGIDYSYFVGSLVSAVPASNYWLGLGKSVVFGTIIALVACSYGLRIKPNTESLGAGTTASVVIAISSVLVADAIAAVLFADVGTGL